jgi:hypothetical protein
MRPFGRPYLGRMSFAVLLSDTPPACAAAVTATARRRRRREDMAVDEGAWDFLCSVVPVRQYEILSPSYACISSRVGSRVKEAGATRSISPEILTESELGRLDG